MSFRLSTGLRNAMMDTDGFKGAFDGCKLCVFSGAIPANADADEGSGVKLLEITVDAEAFATHPLHYGTPAGGSIDKSSSETWQGEGLANGVAAWFRIYGPTVITGASTTAVRLDGTVNTSNADMIMTNLSVAAGAITTVDQAEFTLPATV